MDITFAQLVSAYAELGILALCSIMFIVISIYMIKNYKEQNNKESLRVDTKDDVITDTFKDLLKSMQDQNDKLVEVMQKSNEVMMQQFAKQITHHSISPEESAQQTEIDSKLRDANVRIRKETKARRSSIVKYHNGGRGINGQPFLKMSMTHEDLVAGITPLMGDFKEQFRNLLGLFVSTVDTKDICFIANRNELKERDASMYEFMAIRNINTLFGISIKDKSDYPIGFVCLEFGNEDVNIEKIQNLIREDIDEIKELMNQKIL